MRRTTPSRTFKDVEPKRVIIVEAVALPDGRGLPLWIYAWKLMPEQDGMITIEHRDREYRIPAKCAKDVPVTSPSCEHLCRLAPCFTDFGKNLTQVHQNAARMFSVYRCPHGNYFLEDVRGGIAMHFLWIFLGTVENPADDEWEFLWSKYHRLPSDAVYHLGIGR